MTEIKTNFLDKSFPGNSSASTPIKHNFLDMSVLTGESGAPPIVGWPHSLNGVANVNIGSVCGVLLANIAKVNGVE